MALSDLASGDEELVDHEDLTVRDLIQMFGREATRRGLNYMARLDEADRNFREEAEPEKMEEGYRSITEEDPDKLGERAMDGVENWVEESKEKGLGLDDGDEE